MRAVIATAALVLLAGCSTETAATGSATTTTRPAATTSTSIATTTTADVAPVGGAVVVEVVDGDTLVVEIGGGQERLRLVGVNAPERGECLADEATRLLRERLDGQPVELVVDRSERDRYDRLLRFVEADGADVGAELVRAGLAVARRYPPDTARDDEYQRLQAEAEAAGAGMWAPDACGVATAPTGLTISEIRFDADGDDNRNLNDEWVRIANEGGAAVEVGGWVLKDTSATHRYGFPAGFVLGPGATVTVRTGCGVDTATDLHWCNEGSAVWNNSGDTAFLLDPAGNVVDSVDG